MRGKRARAREHRRLIESEAPQAQPDVSDGAPELDAQEPVKANMLSEGESGQLMEAIEKDGSVVDVLVIKAGTSKNRRRYRREVLAEAVQKFDGARAFAGFGPDHSPAERGVRSLVGWWTEPRWYEGTADDGSKVEGVAAHLNILESAAWLRSMAVEAIKRNKPDLFGYSIVGDGPTGQTYENVGGRKTAIRDVKRIDLIESVDPVIHPAAGGQALRLVASKEDPSMDWDKLTLTEAITKLAKSEITADELAENRQDLSDIINDPDKLTEALTVEKTVEVEVEKIVEKIVEAAPAEKEEPSLEDRIAEAVTSALKPHEQAKLVESVLVQRNLKPYVADRIRSLTEGQELDAAGVEKVIEAELAYIKESGGAPVVKDAGTAKVSDIKDERERFTEGMTAILDGSSNESMRSLYVELTGDTLGKGKLQEGGRLTESIDSTTFAEIFADSATKAMQKVYALPGLDTWRNVASSVPLSDFKQQHRIRMGGYGNLPGVNQGAPYLPLTTPGDEQAYYAPTKRGGTEDLTIEAIMNDDLGQMRNIPRRLGRSAAQTLHEFVWDYLRTNANVSYEATALAHADHGNLGSTALSAISLTAARTAMRQQTDFSSGKRLGIRPATLVVPIELEQTAYELTQTDREVSSANNTLNFVRTFGLQVIVVDYWTDTNNWWVVADAADIDRIEVGFLNGQEQPELFLQDAPTAGNVFTNDVLTYKIRHIYGAAVLDHRAFYGAIVA